MSPDRATAILALVEANRALELAHRALRRMGSNEHAVEVAEMAEDTNSIMTELTSSEQPSVGVAS